MTAPALLRITDDGPGDEVRAFLASYGATWGWSSWSCACGHEGEAPTRVDAERALRVHVVSAHVPAGDAARVTAGNVLTALTEAAQ